MATAAQPKKQLLPFTRGTRRRFQTIGQYPFVPGQPVPTITLPQVGFLSRVFCKIEGTITQPAAGNVSAFGYADLINRVRLNANLGSASIIDLSGRGAVIASNWNDPSGGAKGGTVQNVFANANAANPVSFGFALRVNANDRTELTFGLIDLQAPEVRVTLDVIANALTAFVDNASASALTLYVGYEYWEVPDPTRFEMPARTLVRTLEEAPIAILAAGDQVYQIPRLGTLSRMSSLVVLNGAPCSLVAPSPDVTTAIMRVNKTDTIQSYDTRFKEIDEAVLYNQDVGGFLRPGTVTWDFWRAGAMPWGGGPGRDFVDTEAVTTLESIITLKQGVAIAGVSQIQYVRQVLQRLA